MDNHSDNNSSSLLDVQSGSGIETWIMNSAPVNALSPPFLAAMKERLDAANANTPVSAVVLTSGLRVFSAGGDAGWMGRGNFRAGAAAFAKRFG